MNRLQILSNVYSTSRVELPHDSLEDSNWFFFLNHLRHFERDFEQLRGLFKRFSPCSHYKPLSVFGVEPEQVHSRRKLITGYRAMGPYVFCWQSSTPTMNVFNTNLNIPEYEESFQRYSWKVITVAPDLSGFQVAKEGQMELPVQI